MARGAAETTDLILGSSYFRHVRGTASSDARSRHLALLDALAEAPFSNSATSRTTVQWYEIDLEHCKDHDWGIVVEFSAECKALLVCGVVRNSVADFWRRMPDTTKLQVGDQIVKINDTPTAHGTGSFHPKLRLILEQSDCIKLLIARGYPLFGASFMNVYEEASDIPVDGAEFVLSKSVQLPQVMGITHYMISNYSHHFAVPPDMAELLLRRVNDDDKVTWTRAHTQKILPPHEQWYEKAFNLPQGCDLGIVVKYSNVRKALIVCGTVKDSFSHLEWQSQYACRQKLQMGDQFVRINGCDTAHITGSFHPRLRRIIAHDNSYTFQVRRKFELCRSPRMKVYKGLEDIVCDPSYFVLSRYIPLPYDLGVTASMINHYANCHNTSLELAELNLRELDEMTQQAFTVPNFIVYEF